MHTIQEKAHFLQYEYTDKLTHLSPNAPAKWGKMNVQQMIEHMSDYVRIANGKTALDMVTAADMVPRMQAFIASDKPFKENTPNVLMSETPGPVRHLTKEAAVVELQRELDDFIETYKDDHSKKIGNPFFGELDFDLQVQLLYKHSTHHLRQFGVE